MKRTGHALVILGLTILTQLGGLAWGLALFTRWRWRAFPLIYLAIWAVAQLLAPLAGRQPLPCTGAPLRMQSIFYCAALRNFVVPELADLAHDAAARVADKHPGTITLALDGGFPIPGLPMLPHLSHTDGRKLDFALFYKNSTGDYLPGKTQAPLGYFAFETRDHPQCPAAFPTLRWDFRWMQAFYPDRPIDDLRTKALGQALLDDPRLGKMLLEPALAGRLGLADPKLRFQGCRAARHDDHFHVQL